MQRLWIDVHKLVVAALWIANCADADSTVYIIRHGEKTWGGGCLNIQGQERANDLPNIFNGKGNFSAPAALFANKYNGPPQCERCWLTVQPIAQALRLDVDFSHGYPQAIGGNQAGADAIKSAAKTHKVVLVAWYLTADLGV